MSGSDANTPSNTLPSLVLHQISQAEALLGELKRQLHHFGPLTFALATGEKLTKIRDEFSYELKRGKGNEEHAEGVCREFSARIRRLVHESFPLLAPVSNIFIPTGLLLPITNFARRFGDFELSFSPCWTINYEVLELGAGTTKPFLFISYPLVEWTNTLLHVLLIHEVFHYVEYTERLGDILGKEIALEKTAIQALVDQIRTQVGEKKQEEIEEALEVCGVRDKCLKICMGWLKEFICDLLSIRTAGLAYFFALEQFGKATDSMAKASDTHPPTFVRLKRILDELEKMNYLIEPHRLKETLREWNEKLSQNLDLKFGTPLQEVAHRCLENNFPIVAKRVQNKFEELKERGVGSFDVGRFLQAEEIEAYFCKGIPPIDIWDKNSNPKKNKPIDMFTIWNAAWLCYIKDMENFYKTVGASEPEKQDALKNFNAILLKALESSEILRIAIKH